MYYAQNSYPNVKLGTSQDSIKQDGCALIAFCNIAGTDPIVTNQKFIQAGDYANGELIEWANCARTLGLPYTGTSTNPQVYPCIAETDHFAPAYPSHYFVLLDPRTIVDSLDGLTKSINTYHIVSIQNVTTPPMDNWQQIATDRLTQINNMQAAITAKDQQIATMQTDINAKAEEITNLKASQGNPADSQAVQQIKAIVANL